MTVGTRVIVDVSDLRTYPDDREVHGVITGWRPTGVAVELDGDRGIRLFAWWRMTRERSK
jgi:hypothetical protein